MACNRATCNRMYEFLKHLIWVAVAASEPDFVWFPFFPCLLVGLAGCTLAYCYFLNERMSWNDILALVSLAAWCQKVVSYHLNQRWQISKHSMTSIGRKYLNDSSHTNGEMEFGTYTSFNQLCLIFMVKILTFINIANINNVVQILPTRCKSKGCFSRMCTVVGICEPWYITNFANAITIVITCSRIKKMCTPTN